MLYLSILLHIYQPPTQFAQVTKEITNSSYRLILKILKKSQGKITLNINASLTEQLARLGQEDVIQGISDLAKKKQIEFTGSAAYHPLLPRLPKDLMKRQITLNTQINKKYFGDLYCPGGFFPPEMAYSNSLGELLTDLNFDYVVVDEHAYPGRIKKAKHDVIYVKPRSNNVILGSPSATLGINSATPESDSGQVLRPRAQDRGARMTGKPLNVFFRDDDLSLAIAFSQIKTITEFRHLTSSVIAKQCQTIRDRHGPLHGPRDDNDTDSYIVIALDGETFGHHQLGQDKLLTDILNSKLIKIVTISELKKYFHKEKVIRPLTSCWGASDEDMRKKIYWPRWSYPGNSIHKLQWELTKLVIKSENGFWTRRVPDGNPSSQNDEPTLFDKSLHSDQYWWASHKPYWHPEMIRRGAKMLLDTLKLNPRVSSRVKKQGERLYNDIVETAHKMYGEVIIST